MDEEEAFRIFAEWYERCLENGIEPELVVEKMGGMMLITNDVLVEKILTSGLLDQD